MWPSAEIGDSADLSVGPKKGRKRRLIYSQLVMLTHDKKNYMTMFVLLFVLLFVLHKFFLKYFKLTTNKRIISDQNRLHL